MCKKNAVLALACAVVLYSAPVDTASRIAPGETADLSLAPGHPVSVLLEVGASQAASLIVDQDEPSLQLRILAEDGTEIRSVSPGFSGPMVISMPAANGTGLRVVATVGAAIQTPAALTMLLEPSPPANADMSALREAEEIFRQAQLLRREPDANSTHKAIGLLRRAREGWRDGDSRSGQAVALQAEGDAWYQLSRYTEALRAYTAAQGLVARNSWLAASLLNAEAAVDLELWRREEAREAAANALAISRSLRDGRAEADALANLAIARWLLSDAKGAADLQEALKAARARGNRLALARLLSVEAWLERDLGHRREAIELMEESAGRFQQVGSVLDALTEMSDIASVERMRGDAFSAIVTHSKMAQLFHQAGAIFHEASADTNLGIDYIALNRARDGLPYLQEGRRLYSNTGNVWAAQAPIALSCETEVALRLFSSAQADCQEAKRLAVQFHSPVHIALAEFRLGKLAEARGDVAVAAANYRQAAALEATVGYRPGEASATLSLGLMQYRRVAPEAAMELFEKALSLSQQAEDPAQIIEAKYQIARVSAATGRLADAQRQLQDAAELSESERDKIRSDRLRSSYFAAVRKCYDLYVDVLMRRHAANPRAGFDRAALERSEAGRARTLYDALNLKAASRGQGSTEGGELVRLRTELDQRYEARLKLIIGGHKQRDVEENAGDIRRLSAAYEQALAAAATEEPPAAAFTPIAAADLVRASSESILLEYHLGEERSYLWRIEHGEIASFRLPGRKTIGDAVEKWRELASARQRRPGENFTAYRARVEAADRELPVYARKLSCMLLPGLHFEKDTRLTVIADGSLQALPFGALPVDCHAANSPPLIAAHEVANASSLRILTAAVEHTPSLSAKKDVAILADPVFSTHDSRVGRAVKAPAAPAYHGTLTFALRDAGFGAELPRLYGTRKEAEAIAALASPGSALLALDFRANLKTALSTELANYRIWHFATHGLLDAASPDLSGLVFSLVDSEGRPTPGYLTIQDIFDLSIDPDLVVLSACSSGLGEQVPGEGAVGLSYAFLHAGAKQVISTLWNVEDNASSELMAEFYRGVLRDRLPAAGALRKAQIAILSRKHNSQPFYWAGYLLMASN